MPWGQLSWPSADPSFPHFPMKVPEELNFWIRLQKEALEDALADLGVEQGEAEDEELERRLAAIPDLSESLRKASTQIKRQVYEAFDLRIHFDKREGRIEISATVSEEVAKAFEDSEAVFGEGSGVTLTNIAGAGFEPATFGL